MSVKSTSRLQTITPSEASILARIAQNPKIDAARLSQMLHNASGEVKRMARAIVRVAQRLDSGSTFEPDPDSFDSAALEMIEWARSNREQRESVKKF
jgi:hypothetical protein